MARPIKEGLDYFPLDVVFDEKIQALESVFKNDGLVWMIKFWQSAYRSSDGEVSLDNYHGVIHQENCRVTPEKHTEILKLCLEIGLLVKSNGNKYTSNGIKKRFYYVVGERERWRIKHKVGVTSPIIPIENQEETGESKVKESKVKEIKKGRFSDFWSLYPKQVGASMACLTFKTTVKTDKDFEDIKTALRNYKESDEFKKGFIKNGDRWIEDWRGWLLMTPKKEDPLSKWENKK